MHTNVQNVTTHVFRWISSLIFFNLKFTRSLGLLIWLSSTCYNTLAKIYKDCPSRNWIGTKLTAHWLLCYIMNHLQQSVVKWRQTYTTCTQPLKSRNTRTMSLCPASTATCSGVCFIAPLPSPVEDVVWTLALAPASSNERARLTRLWRQATCSGVSPWTHSPRHKWTFVNLHFSFTLWCPLLPYGYSY